MDSLEIAQPVLACIDQLADKYTCTCIDAENKSSAQDGRDADNDSSLMVDESDRLERVHTMASNHVKMCQPCDPFAKYFAMICQHP
jgi:hypothetical protein